MISGECPYCGGTVINEMPDRTPAYCQIECEHCGETYWLECSRIQSYAYTIEAFEAAFVIDEEARTVTKRDEKAA